ncbi:MAG: cellulase family glycosylhydrolase [Cyclobacteriaceae bacterium]
MNRIIGFVLFLIVAQCVLAQQFVSVEGTGFQLEGKPYQFIGTNLWYGMNLGVDQKGRERLTRELDRLSEMGVTNLRVLASSEGADQYNVSPVLQTAPGAYSDQVWKGLDFLLDEMGKRNMKAVMVLNNFWMWSGGFPQYVKWVEGGEVPFPNMEGGTWDPFINYSLSFYSNKKAQNLFRDHLKVIISRTNSINGVAYRDDPAIMSWQLCNEPRGYDVPEQYRKWLVKTAKLIQSLDKNHLVSVGSEGDTSTPRSGVDLIKDNQSKYIDYATTHVWIQNWGWFDPEDESSYRGAQQKAKDYLTGQMEKAEQLGKPVVIEEFGVSRDGGDFNSAASVSYRDKFYEFVFQFTVKQLGKSNLQGCNFWSWAGEGRPTKPGGFWQEGENLIGDPPHERQGWYSVYDDDQSTVELIEKYAREVKNQ